MEHKWRREIKDEYLIDRIFILEANRTVEDEFLDVAEEGFSHMASASEDIGRQEIYFDFDSDDERSTDSGSDLVCFVGMVD